MFAVITCTTSTPCTGGNNTGTGAGVEGQSKSSHGLIGNTLFNSTGPSNGESAVFGQDLSTAGVYNMGVQGVSIRGYGVRGRSQSNSGVRGDSTSGAGVYGNGIYGISGNGDFGVVATGAEIAAVAMSPSVAVSASSFAGPGQPGTGVLSNASGNGGDFTGHIGVVGRSNDAPFVATDENAKVVFYVDEKGDVFYHGALTHFERTNGVTTVTSYARTTSPAIEETGTAHLVYGSANVYFSSSFARSVDPRLGYQVFLTPGGDTRGLYVASKYAGGFVVHEVQGGRGTFNFDYHVYAQTAPAAAAMHALPSAPLVTTPNIQVPRTPH
ncbi:MAG: hypothetical protein JO322_10695 [Candidatus Eremiobacteraeota bacterium]|nr:hypothetical protein [Candidatus Eremiobacteraeota bacterium]